MDAQIHAKNSDVTREDRTNRLPIITFYKYSQFLNSDRFMLVKAVLTIRDSYSTRTIS